MNTCGLIKTEYSDEEFKERKVSIELKEIDEPEYVKIEMNDDTEITNDYDAEPIKFEEVIIKSEIENSYENNT